ncbi:hypothetical protein P280DRAFT_399510 [Massarina eburnea CBS 473.64]|uniref:Sld7 C-terminal domain-containing protein n=1 Tax=Massarina eburnea CBS 473.64 TaxID=1395130 RepID=A0A6A6RYP9_9PLEO|nr:hypothetical protein P280DRAFT_399510 [Massarina eburnea CBS 473.64]
MTDIWNGSIVLPNGTAITDIGFASQNVASAPTISGACLRFLSTVDTARVPLYLAAGPSLDVWTTTGVTEEWFASILSSKPTAGAGDGPARQWWTNARAQSPIGFLVKVDDGGIMPSGLRITEMLFYGTVTTSPGVEVLPTPPSSSPDVFHVQSDAELPELKIHALPLSSDLLHQGALRELPPLSPALNTNEPRPDTQPQFLPPQHTPETTPISPKRKLDLVEEAAQARKRARTAAVAAAKEQESQRAYGHRKSMSIDTKIVPLVDSRPGSAQGARSLSRPLSRSPSLSSDMRPLSRKGVSEGHAKRSTLSQVATVPIQPEEPTTETRNKEALSRVVMTAMRMHGLQQRKNKSRRGSLAPGVDQEQLSEKATAEEAAKDEEYKQIYHQTYKGAALALRKHIATKPLHSQPDRLRDIVEKLLAIFCTDPLAQPLPGGVSTDPLATPGRLGVPGSTHSHASPFDMPSTARKNTVKPVTEGVVYTGSPVSRRAKRPAKYGV